MKIDFLVFNEQMVKTLNKSWFSNFSKMAFQHSVSIDILWLLYLLQDKKNLGGFKSQFQEEKYLFLPIKKVLLCTFTGLQFEQMGYMMKQGRFRGIQMEDRLHICEAYETKDMALYTLECYKYCKYLRQFLEDLEISVLDTGRKLIKRISVKESLECLNHPRSQKWQEDLKPEANMRPSVFAYNWRWQSRNANCNACQPCVHHVPKLELQDMGLGGSPKSEKDLCVDSRTASKTFNQLMCKWIYTPQSVCALCLDITLTSQDISGVHNMPAWHLPDLLPFLFLSTACQGKETRRRELAYPTVKIKAKGVAESRTTDIWSSQEAACAYKAHTEHQREAVSPKRASKNETWRVDGSTTAATVTNGNKKFLSQYWDPIRQVLYTQNSLYSHQVQFMLYVEILSEQTMVFTDMMKKKSNCVNANQELEAVIEVPGFPLHFSDLAMLCSKHKECTVLLCKKNDLHSTILVDVRQRHTNTPLVLTFDVDIVVRPHEPLIGVQVVVVHILEHHEGFLLLRVRVVHAG
ncbi:hypothetical protein L345_04431, partial [Ophiophagus hannah]